MHPYYAMGTGWLDHIENSSRRYVILFYQIPQTNTQELAGYYWAIY